MKNLIEILNQIIDSGHEVWITYVAARIELLIEDYGVTCPIAKNIFKLAEKHFENLEKNL